MLSLLFVAALCSLLSPSQAEETATVQITMCNGTLEKLFTDTLNRDLLNLLLHNKILPVGEQEHGGGGSIIGGLVGGVNQVAAIAGITIKNASLLRVEVSMPNNDVKVKLTTCLVLEINGKIQGMDHLPLLGSKTYFAVEIATDLTLTASKNEMNNFEVCLGSCTLLDISINVKGSGSVDIVKPLADTVTKHLKDVVGEVLKTLICKTVLEPVLRIVNSKLKLLGGTLPVGELGNVLDCVIKGVKKTARDCLIVDANALHNGCLIDVNKAPSNKLPPMDQDGVAMHKEVINTCIGDLMPLGVMNAKIQKKMRIHLTETEAAKWCPGATELLIVTVTFLSTPKIMLEENQQPIMKVKVAVKAWNQESMTLVFHAELTVYISCNLKSDSGNLMIVMDKASFEDVEIMKSSCNQVKESFDEFLSSLISKLTTTLKEIQLMVPLPECCMDLQNSPVFVKKDCIMLRANHKPVPVQSHCSYQ